jgi:Tol biopolymer transport system component
MLKEMIVAGIAAGLCAAAICSATARAQAPERWDTSQARGQTRQLDFVTDEGSWMSLDVAPDGRWIVFDLLGHIYRVPIEGGAAQCLTQDSGIAVNFHPRISPDGRSIAFISERGGYHNLWIMSADGSAPRRVVEERDIVVSAPAWSPDGSFLIAQRVSTQVSGSYPKASRSLWRYPARGGAPTQLMEESHEGVSAPAFSPDGRELYYQYFTGRDARNVDHTVSDYKLVKRDLASGATTIVAINGGIVPRVSPDGRWLAFSRRVAGSVMKHAGHEYGPRNALWLLDLRTQQERVIMDPIEPDIADGGNVNTTIPALLPGYSWTPDSAAIVIAQGGKIRRLDVASGKVSTIEFSARVQRTMSERASATMKISDGPFKPRYLTGMRASPDGKQVVFEAAGRLWIADLARPRARRLTPSQFAAGEFMPAWSADSRTIAFVSWNPRERGHVWTISASGGEPHRITAAAAEFASPLWSEDGKSLIVVRGWGATGQGRAWADNPEYTLVRMPLDAGEAEVIATVAPRIEGTISISWGPGHRLFFAQDVAQPYEPLTQLVSVRADGSDRRTHLSVPYAAVVSVSPDGKWVAAEKRSDVFVMPFDWRATEATITRAQFYEEHGSIRRVTREGGLDPHWRSADRIEFGGNAYFVHEVGSGKTRRVAMGLDLPKQQGRGRTALVGARLITLRGDEVVERGTIVIDGSRISCVGQCSSKGADTVLDVSGATIVPGFIDAHGSFVEQSEKLAALGNAEAAAYLAYGVTTSFAPSNASHFIYPLAEMIEAGTTVGPRMFSAADYYRRDDNAGNQFVDIRDVRQARDDAHRNARFGAIALKNLTLSTAVMRQQLAEAARAQGMLITGHLETGFLEHGLSLAMEGYSAAQHFPATVPLYGDVAKFFGRSGFIFNLTLGRMGTIRNDAYFIARGEFGGDEKRARLFPPHSPILADRSREWRAASDYPFTLQADAVSKIIAEGGAAAIGTHGPGYAAHWEVWMLASALGPHGALRSASLHGARFLGAERDLGSIEVGKLADLIVLDANPLDDIRNTTGIRHVVKAGVLYDGDTAQLSHAPRLQY